MDANKLKVLREVAYKIGPSCGMCVFGKFPNDDWGTCSAHQYDHRKHSGPPRQLSVHRLGECPTFKADPRKSADLQGFVEFIVP